MQTFNILDPNLNVFQSRFLEASAGTGKTFSIEHLFVRFLLESKTALPLEKILAVTFTREAAHEMKNRIRKKLEAYKEDKDPRVLDALASFEEAQVFTIHGFCHRMLKEFAFEAKVPLSLASPDKPDHLQEMRIVVEDFFRTGDEKFAGEVSYLCKRMRYDLDKLIHKIVEAMQSQKEPTPILFPKLPKISSKKLSEEFFSIASRYKRMKFHNLEEQIEKFSFYLDQKDSALLMEEKVWFFEKLKEEEGFFYHLQQEFNPILQVLRSPEEMILRIAKECLSRWEVKATRQDHFTFDDLLKKMLEALEIPSFFQKVQSKYQAVIVDEFQDTDPLQWEIFKRLFHKTHILYLVGDAKQSIYGFRSADIYTYMQAGDCLGKENRAYLDTNYRSSPQLVEALNDLFTKNPDWLALPSLPHQLSYHVVKPGRGENILRESPIVYFGVKADPGREKNWPTKTMEEQSLFPYIAREIIRLKKHFSFCDFAVLIKDRFQAQRLQLFLQRLKIPSTIKKTLHLAESKGFIAMEMFLKALTYPEKDAYVQAALKGPFMNGEHNPFFELRKLFLDKGFAVMFSYFLKHHFQAYHDNALYEELCQTAEILMEFRSAELIELLHFMQEWKKVDPMREEKLQLRSEQGVDKVAIMTTFASKGLEFEVVFALGMASRHNEEETAEKQAEKMRQLYVAFTRAREKLYIPRLFDLSQKSDLPPGASPIELFFQNIEVPIDWIESIPLQLYQSEQPQKTLVAPPKIHCDFPTEILTSFTSMAKSHSKTILTEKFQMQDFSQKTAHTLPLGAETGTVIHTVFEQYFEDLTVSPEQIVCEILSGTLLEGWEEVIAQMVKDVLQLPLIDAFSLSQLKEGEYFQEMEFLFPQEKQWIKGFVDLVFKRGKTFYLLDWKTNWLGPSDEDYTEERIEMAMKEHDYYLQAKLYKEALVRYVKRLDKGVRFGGAFYLFLRGKKAVHLGLG